MLTLGFPYVGFHSCTTIFEGVKERTSKYLPVRNISNKQSAKPSILRNPFKILKYSNFFTFFNRIKYVVLEIYRVALFALSTIKSQKKKV